MDDIDFDHRLTTLQKDLVQHRYRTQTIEADVDSLENDLHLRGQALLELETTLTALASILSPSFIPSVSQAVGRRGGLPVVSPTAVAPEAEDADGKKKKQKKGLFGKFYDHITDAADALNDKYDGMKLKSKSKSKKKRSSAEKAFDPDSDDEDAAKSATASTMTQGMPVGAPAGYGPEVHAQGSVMGAVSYEQQQQQQQQHLPLPTDPAAIERMRQWLAAPPQQQWIQRCLTELASNPAYMSYPPDVQQARMNTCHISAQHALVRHYYDLFPHERPVS